MQNSFSVYVTNLHTNQWHPQISSQVWKNEWIFQEYNRKERRRLIWWNNRMGTSDPRLSDFFRDEKAVEHWELLIFEAM